ncbi:putative disease resistance protein at4g19050 [Phtheirospermum japonicum]|uniref:Putative disease resistance protein at4g19050 n=1 Tax=Phtheirospermum japonicum TaxID=374723 RepID=A0A830C0P4_9LAMI|nr:putative disease resistance protein at4g19050 [Phtheirospermum japonicum]
MSVQVSTVMGSKALEDEFLRTLEDEFLRIMSQYTDSEEVLKDAFEALSKAQTDHDLIPADLFQKFTTNRGMELTIEEIEETINQVKNRTKNEGNINYDEFIEIIKLLMNPTVMDQLKRIYEALDKTDHRKTFVLHGEPGVGKTWMARKIADRAIRRDRFDVALWIYLDGIYSPSTLQESIVRQLSILPISDESQAKADEKEDPIHSVLKQKRLLLIFDDEGNKMKIRAALDKEELLLVSNDGVTDINLYKTLALDQLESYTFLVTRKNRPASGEFGMTVLPLTDNEAKSFVKDESVKDLADFFISKSKKFPSDILIISKIFQSEPKLQKLKNDIEKLEKDKKDHTSFKDFKMLLINGYDKLPKSVLIDCFSSETSEGHFLNRGIMVDYNELISYWIMEGHLGHFDRIEDAYEEGHRVLMELLECGLLRNQESGRVVSGGEKFNFDVHEYYEFFRSVRLGLATSFDNKLGKIAATNGMIRTVSTTSSGQKERKTPTLLLDGNYIGGIKSGEIFNSDGEIENLAIFNPTGKYLPLPMSKMAKLGLLVLRGCKFLDTTEMIFDFPDQNISLENLKVFEISGPSSLKNIPDNFFDHTPKLKNLNLSSLEIESLPGSFYTLTKIETLILRGCSSLKELSSLRNFVNLEVLDVSGSQSISSIHDKRFSKNKKLRIINLSETKIETLPLIHSLGNLKSLSLTDCSFLLRIRRSGSLQRLQILDISGASKVEEFLDPSLEGLENLDFLDASRTNVVKLPSNIGNPRYFYLKNCPRLEKLTPIEGLSKIEVLDLSGSTKLREIRVEFFKNVKALRELNLSKTSVNNLSFISCLGTLRKLFLSHCLSLEKFEKNLSELEELEILDFSGCENLKEIEGESFDKMPRLYSLNLSGLTQLDKLPSLSKLTSLKKLYVRNCPKITNLPGLEEIPALETLDHSRTFLRPSPKFHPDCHAEVLGPIFVSSEKINAEKLLRDLGADNLSELTHPEHEQEGSNEECNWSISNWRGEENGHNAPVSGVHFLCLLKMYPSLVRNNFGRFNFLIYPSEVQAAQYLPNKYEYSDNIGLREVYLSQVTQQDFDKRLEIRGFNYVPLCAEHLLQESEFIVVIDSPFLRDFHELGIDCVKKVKACWIERCNEMEHVIVGENNNLDNLEILWVSDVMKLKSLFSLEIQNISFQSLKSLYLEFCPNLDMLCSSYLQLQNLEILYIKYCQKLGSLFSDDDSLAKLDKLTALHLWGLPELKKIACKAHSLTTLRIGECPLLENISISAPEEQEIEFEGHDKLEILHVKFCDKLRTAFQTRHKDVSAYLPRLQELEVWGLPEMEKIGCSAPNLKSLKIAECPLLESVVDMDGVSENLKIVEVKCCDKLKTIFQGGETTERSLGMDRMELLCLPELKSIGVRVKEENCTVWGCPKLKFP